MFSNPQNAFFGNTFFLNANIQILMVKIQHPLLKRRNILFIYFNLLFIFVYTEKK